MSSSNQHKGSKKNLTKQLEKQTNLTKEYLNHLQRLQAEFENFQKRTNKEKQILTLSANQDLILQLIEVLDNFERATLDKGIELIYKQFKTILQKQGLKEITNTEFDPNLNQAITKVKSKEKENTIIEILQKGYTLNDKTIRPSKVKLAGGQNE